MFESSVVHNILDQFDVRSNRIEPLGNAGGFSGSEIYRIEADDQTLCLKKWPQSSDKKKLHWIHRVLIFTAADGCPELATPRAARDGSTFVSDQTGSWELTPWAKGEPDYLAKPNEARLTSALNFLARFHQASARFHFEFSPSQNAKLAAERLTSFDDTLSKAAKSPLVHNYFSRQQLQDFGNASKFVPELRSCLSDYSFQPLPTHAVIRDIRAEHLYFEGDKLVSVIDFGAMKIDSLACDLSRMLGDCCSSDRQKILQALDRYHAIRPLSEPERNLIPLLDHASVVIGILNWMQWLLLEKREFEDFQKVRLRICSLMQRLATISRQ